MEFKEGSPVMLLHNLHVGPVNGLHNGTRMVIQHLGECIIEAEITRSVNNVKRVLIVHITLIPSDTEFPFTLKQWLFPLCPCFAMSTNKAQG